MKLNIFILQLWLMTLVANIEKSDNYSQTIHKNLFLSYAKHKKSQNIADDLLFSRKSPKDNLKTSEDDLEKIISTILVTKFNKTYTIELIPNFIEYMPIISGILLHSAVSEKKLDVLESLIYFGTKVDIVNRFGVTPLYKAIESSQDEVINLLIHVGADPNYSKNNVSLLHRAVNKGLINVIKSLIKLGATVDTEDSAGRTPLYYAIKRNQTQVINSLLESGANINFKSKQEKSLLHTAILKKDVKVVKKLIQLGCKIEEPDQSGKTPMFLSLLFNDPDLTQELLSKGANINFIGPDGDTLLHKAISGNELIVIKKLLHMGANQLLVDSKGLTPLYKAIKDNKTDVIDCLIEDTDLLNEKSPLTEDYAINFAVENGTSETVKFLLERGAYKYARNKKGHFPLVQAILQNKTKIIEILLYNNTYNLNVNTMNSQNKPIHLAVMSRNTQIAEFLLNHGALVNVTNKEGKTPLAMAVESNNVDMAQLLINQGADLSYTSTQGDTLLHIAVSINAMEAATLLLDYGLDVDKANKRGYTPLFKAIINNNRILIRLLASKGANINSRMRNGETPLHLAIGNSSLSTVFLLVELGAEIDTNKTTSPIEKAVRENRADVIRLLVSKGAPLHKKKSLLHMAAEYDSDKAIQILLNMGLPVDLEWGSNTPLWVATKNNNVEAMKACLKNGANINVTTLPPFPIRGAVTSTWTLLHEAIFRNHLNASELLLEHGIDPNKEDFRSWTPLHYAAIMNKVEFVELLLKWGSDPALKTNNGLSAIGMVEYSHEKGKYKTINLIKTYIEKRKNNSTQS